MEYLLDTHAFLWFVNGSIELSPKAKDIIQNLENTMYLSIASFWEIAIKLNIGKLAINTTFDELKQAADKNNFRNLPIKYEDTRLLTTLELFHKDPFDRILIAQAMQNNLTIITKDAFFKEYPLTIIW
jgi:PIN domain nuclease of toxin-antitoxin system